MNVRARIPSKCGGGVRHRCEQHLHHGCFSAEIRSYGSPHDLPSLSAFAYDGEWDIQQDFVSLPKRSCCAGWSIESSKQFKAEKERPKRIGQMLARGAFVPDAAAFKLHTFGKDRNCAIEPND
jgi:hypothetical protein